MSPKLWVLQQEDTKMGEDDKAMEYDQELIFKHLYALRHIRSRLILKYLLDASTLTPQKPLAPMVWP